MKAVTLTSLLAASAVTGAAAGGPFFFAMTTPQAIAFDSFTSGATTPGFQLGQSIVVSTDFVITDFSALLQSSGNFQSHFVILVNGAPQHFVGLLNSKSHVSLSSGSGIPVPAGSTLRIESSGNSAGKVSVVGYHY